MSYATQQNMIDRFGLPELTGLTDLSNTGMLDVNVLGQALADANNEIDGYLSGVFSLPLITVPPRLIKLACDIARYELYGVHCSDQVRQRYTDAIAYLKLVVTGVASLGLDPLNNAADGTSAVSMNPNRPVFAQCQLRDYNKPPYHL